MNVRQLVKLYQQGRDAEDVAGPHLKCMGTPARDELIQLLDDQTTSPEDDAAIIEILRAYFPSEESYQAMDRCVARMAEPNRGKLREQVGSSSRAHGPRLRGGAAAPRTS